MSSVPLKTIGAYVLVFVGVAAVVVFSALAIHPNRVTGATPHTSSLPSNTAALRPLAGAASESCAFGTPSVAAAGLRQAQMHAREFLDQQNPSEALSRFRSIAAVDPGLPGINLDLSTSLLKLHQTDSAKVAINNQLGISDCLSRLAPAKLDEYCRTQMDGSTALGCREDLAAIERSAHFQSALVQMALASPNGVDASTPGTSASVPAFGEVHRPAARLLASSRSDDTASQKKPAIHAAAAKPEHKNLLAGGEGTDAALGAYSK